jgi:5-amino-6-(5-phosphoribosylamino)uracil reductase
MADEWKNRPHTTVVLAMSADGKIADIERSPARFSSATDRAHLEEQIATADAVLFGAGTLRAYGTTLRVSHPQLLQQRKQNSLPPQPLQIIASLQANIDPQLRFFGQPVPRWLLTTSLGAQYWQGRSEFERILICKTTSLENKGTRGQGGVGDKEKKNNSAFSIQHSEFTIDWVNALKQLARLGVKRLAVLGGGELVASMLAFDAIDELWLTVCPLILGGANAPTPVEGTGFYAALAPRLELLSAQVKEQEVFLHYRLQR